MVFSFPIMTSVLVKMDEMGTVPEMTAKFLGSMKVCTPAKLRSAATYRVQFSFFSIPIAHACARKFDAISAPPKQNPAMWRSILRYLRTFNYSALRRI